MAKKKERKLYNADELKALKVKLVTHKGTLIDRIARRVAQPVEFSDACELRDDVQLLVTVCIILDATTGTDSIIDMAIFLAENDKPQAVPHLDECGMELNK